MNEFAKECERKDKLLEAFSALEKIEKETRRLLPKLERRYERQVRGWAVIDQIGTETLRLTLETGETLKVPANREICQLIRPTDSLSLLCGLRDRRWRLLFVDVIVSPMPSSERTAELNTALGGGRAH